MVGAALRGPRNHVRTSNHVILRGRREKNKKKKRNELMIEIEVSTLPNRSVYTRLIVYVGYIVVVDTFDTFV